MFRQSPRRNGRNKGLKKNRSQISVLLCVSIWLLYQVHHSNDKKAISVETNINEKPRNDSSKDMFKLGRKDLRPKVMETSIKDSKEAEEHHVDEQGNRKEDEKLAHDHESEEHEEIGDNKHGDGRGYSKDNADGIRKYHKNRDKNGSRKVLVRRSCSTECALFNDNIQTGHEGEQKKDGGSKKEATKEGNKRNEMENKKESLTARGKEINIVLRAITEEFCSNVPSVDESQLGSSQSHNDASTNSATNSEKEKQGDENQNNEVETVTLSKEANVNTLNTTPVSFSTPSVDHETPSVDHETAASVDRNLRDSNNSNRNEKNDEGDIDSGAQDMEQVPNENKDDASVLEDEKDALTDLGTLPDNETGGHITSEDSDTE
ncbi:hypothetical protein Tco_1244997 [Tanacetum coccineum]